MRPADPAPDLFPHAVLPPASHAAHRARLRHRLLAGGPEAITDHEMLEMVLFLALPRCDTKPVADRLIRRFGSFAAAIMAPPGEIAAVHGIGEAGAAALKIVHAAARRLAAAPLITP